MPRRWRQRVQSPQTEADLEVLRRLVVRGSPFGEASWQQRTAKRLGLSIYATPARSAVEITARTVTKTPDPFVATLDPSA